jgi:hypothetical protein
MFRTKNHTKTGTKARNNAAARADARKRAAALASRKDSAALREIGDLPAVQDQARRDAAAGDLQTFCETYFPRRFCKQFGRPHAELIGALEKIIQHGGLKAVALPRGYGKTTLIDAAVLWAVLYGYRSYVAYLAATGPAAKKRVASLKRELSANDLLQGDFPEVCFPLRKLQGISQRAHGQTYQGTPTAIVWSTSQLVLPTIDGSPASGAVIECGGLLSAVRGLQHVTPAGEVRRPDVAVLDDPQTRKSAKSRGQTQTREELVTGDLLYLAGHDKAIACVCSCTVIYPDDLADRLTDRKRNPEWQGQREKMLAKFPARMDLWDQYGDLRRQELRDKGTAAAANAMYRAHRKQMDRGAKVTWDGLGSDEEDSPLQHAMNLYYRDRAAFACEGQNDPEQPDQGDVVTMNAGQILAKRSEFPPLTCPPNTLKITAFADVHKTMLYYGVAAYGPQLAGHLLTFGTWPDQGKHYVTLSTVGKTIQLALPTLGTLQAQILAALQALAKFLTGLQIKRPDGKRQPIDLLMVDGNWGATTDQVYQFAATAPLPTLPSHGRYYGARHKPLGMTTPEAGTNAGPHWMVPPIRAHRQSRAAVWDTNRWKSDLARALAAPPGTPGAWYLPAMPDDHLRMLVEQLTSETAVKVSGPYGDVEEWVLKPNEDNHLLDCCVGTLVGASILGLTRTPTPAAATPKRSVQKPRTSVRF